MKKQLLPFLIATVGSVANAAAASDPQSYYEFEGQSTRPRRPAGDGATPPAPGLGSRRNFVVDSDASSSPAARPVTNTGPAESQAVRSGQPALPPNMERGVRDLEAGMDELKVYTTVMGAHIQQNGIRGFLAVPPEIKEQGTSVGRKIGGGINGIMTDTAHDMVLPEKRN